MSWVFLKSGFKMFFSSRCFSRVNRWAIQLDRFLVIIIREQTRAIVCENIVIGKKREKRYKLYTYNINHGFTRKVSYILELIQFKQNKNYEIY